MQAMVKVDDRGKEVKISLTRGVLTFPMVKRALTSVKGYLDRGYHVTISGYSANKELSREIKAFMFALEILGQKEKIVFVEKARFRRAERRKLKADVKALYSQGRKVKELAQQFKIPEKTIYRWIKE